MSHIKRSIYLVFVFTLFGSVHEVKAQKFSQKDLDSLVNVEAYAEALPLLLKSKSQDAPLVQYQLGLCYFHSSNQKQKSKAFFEFALEYKNESVPTEVYYFLGRINHLTGNYIQAINYYNEYLEFSKGQGKYQDSKTLILNAENGIKYSQSLIKGISVKALDIPINTAYDEFSPYTSPLDNFLIFSSSRAKHSFNYVFGDEYVYLPDDLKSQDNDIYLSHRQGIRWSFPYPQMDFEGRVIRPLHIKDGSYLIFYMEIESDLPQKGHFYEARVKKGRWTKPSKLPEIINSKYDEEGLCLAANGQIMYFASNRPGGYGGFDIYRSMKVGKNAWSEPVNMGPQINSEYDEINPFMHKDNKTLYFSSNRSQSIGGYDIFTTIHEGAEWTKVENLGIPINSPYDEKSYSQIPSRKYAFFASNRNSNQAVGGFDIYSIFKPDKPFDRTIVTGSIIASKNGSNLPLSLNVTDQDNNLYERYIYNPDINDGKFFMILLPKKNYTISIHHKNQELYKLAIDIPEDTYNYELHQKLTVDDIVLLGNVLGQEVKPEESTFQITKLNETSNQVDAKEKRYDALLMLMEMIVDRTDKEGLSTLNDLDDMFPEQEILTADNSNSPDNYYTPLIDLIEKAFNEADPDILKSLGKMRGDEGTKNVYTNSGNDEKGIMTHDVLFPENDYELGNIDRKALIDIANFVKNQREIKIEIIWYKENEDLNLTSVDQLTEMRINSIQNYLDDQGISPYKYFTTSSTINNEQSPNVITIRLTNKQSN